MAADRHPGNGRRDERGDDDLTDEHHSEQGEESGLCGRRRASGEARGTDLSEGAGRRLAAAGDRAVAMSVARRPDHP